MQQITVDIPEKMDEKLDSRKQETGIDKSNQVRTALARYFGMEASQ